MPKNNNAGRTTRPHAPAGNHYAFTVDKETTETGTVLIARNDGPAPVYLTAELQRCDNIASDVAWPLAVDVPPAGRIQMARLYPVDAHSSFAYEYHYHWSVGPSRSTCADTILCALPFPAGCRFKVTQGGDERRTTHDTPESWHAVDIGMPRGTAILAACGGLVFEVMDGFGEGRADLAYLDRANLVRILHDDGTIAEYVHLLAHGMAVQPGQRVNAGDLLGLSGNSGYSNGPHLHFAVQRKQGHQFLSLPVLFTAGGRPPRRPTTGDLLSAA